MTFFHLLLVIFLAIVWGCNFVAIKMGLIELPPIFLCAARFFLTSIPLLFFVKRPQTPFKWVFLYGFIMFALQFSLLFIGMHLGVTAGLAPILLQIQVFFTVLLAIFFFKEKLTLWQAIGGAISCLGIALVGLNIGGSVTASGFILLLCAAFLWGLGSIIAKKMGKVSVMELVVWASLVAWPPLLFVSFMLEGSSVIMASVQQISWISVFSLLYIAGASTLLGFGIWNHLLYRYPLTTLSPFTLLVPIFAMASSSLALGEKIEAWKVIAGLLVILGLGVNFFSQTRFAKKKSLVVEEMNSSDASQSRSDKGA